MNIEIDELIQQEINFGISPQKIIVAGHSQGGSMALAAGLTSKYCLGGIICLAGFLPYYQEILELAKAKDKKAPILICHGTQDTIVPY
jgi:phospholipase/carboxylesterase